jgi:hypothetical protein
VMTILFTRQNPIALQWWLGFSMELQNLINLIASLSSDQQAAVEEFARFLKQNPSSSGKASFQEVLDSFTKKHEDLLRRLAQ